MNDEALKQAYFRGLIPGDQETEVAFAARCEQHTRGCYLLGPLHIDWVPIRVGKDVRLWEAGYTEICPSGATIVLPQHLRAGISHKEVLQHELVHAVRCAFSDSHFEEMLAYQFSSRGYRRLLGPLFGNRLTAWGVLFIAFLGAMLSPWWFSTLLVPCAWMWPTQRVFSRAKKCIEGQIDADIRVLMLSFTKKQLHFLSKASQEAAQTFLRTDMSLQCRQLRAVYAIA